MLTTASTSPALAARARTVVSVAAAWVAICWVRSETRPTCPEISWIELVISSEPAATEFARSLAASADRVRPWAESFISPIAVPRASTTPPTSSAMASWAVITDQVSIGPT